MITRLSEAEATISAFEQLAEVSDQLKPAAPASSLNLTPQSPEIFLDNRRLHEKTDDALEALILANGSTPTVFRQGGALVRLRVDDEVPRVEVLTVDPTRGLLDRAAVWINPKGKYVDPPLSVVRDLLSLPQYPSFPILRAVSEAPFFTSDGRLVAESGYHADPGVFLHLPRGLSIQSVPAVPSTEAVDAARELLLELLGDFPFADAASRANALGLLVLPFVRELIDGPTPLHAIDAPMAGTGKGLLADVMGLIATGRPMEVMTEAKDQEELRKRVTALLLTGSPFGLFDNLTRRLQSGVLAALLTAGRWSDRILGASRIVSLPIRTTWMATGNNLEFSREIARRTVWIRLDAKTAEPHLRDGFRHHPLRTWLRDRRGQVLRAVLLLVQHWVAHGQERFSGHRLGSYESWTEVVGGILAVAGIEGFIANLHGILLRDEETIAWRRFTEVWWRDHGSASVTVDTLMPFAVGLLPEVLGDGSDKSQRTKLGKALSRLEDSRFTVPGAELTLKLVEVTDDKGRRRTGYALEPHGGSQATLGTLGTTTESPVRTPTSSHPNVSPNAESAPPSSGQTLGERTRLTTSALTREAPNIPTSDTAAISVLRTGVHGVVEPVSEWGEE